MNDFHLTGFVKKRALLASIVIGVVMLSANLGCDNRVEPNPPVQEPAPTPEPTPKPKLNPTQTGQVPIISLTPYPRGWVPGTEGWIPPLPPGLSQPVPLIPEDWNRILEVASTDAEVVRQTANNNIRGRVFWWVAYAGGPGNYDDSDAAFMSGKANLPTGEHWWYPGIRFEYHTKTDRRAQIVAVDLETGKIIFSSGWGGVVPSR